VKIEQVVELAVTASVLLLPGVKEWLMNLPYHCSCGVVKFDSMDKVFLNVIQKNQD